MKKKTKKISLGKDKHVIVRGPQGGEVTRAQDMQNFIDENIKDMEEHANKVEEVNYKTLSWCVVEHNLDLDDKELWIYLKELDALLVRKIQDGIEELTRGDAGS